MSPQRHGQARWLWLTGAFSSSSGNSAGLLGDGTRLSLASWQEVGKLVAPRLGAAGTALRRVTAHPSSTPRLRLPGGESQEHSSAFLTALVSSAGLPFPLGVAAFLQVVISGAAAAVLPLAGLCYPRTLPVEGEKWAPAHPQQPEPLLAATGWGVSRRSPAELRSLAVCDTPSPALLPCCVRLRAASWMKREIRFPLPEKHEPVLCAPLEPGWPL